MRRRAWLTALFLHVPLVIGPGEARAQPIRPKPILDLDWIAPAECPDGTRVMARVEELVGRRDASHTLFAQGRVSTSTAVPRYRLSLVIGRSSPDERIMADADCGRLAEAAALILALDIDSGAHANDSQEPTTESADRTDIVPTPAVADRPPPPPPAVRAPVHRDAVAFDVGTRVLLDRGSLPQTTSGIEVLAEVRRGSFSIGVRAATYEPQFKGGPREGFGGAYVDLMTAGAHVCGQSAVSFMEIRGCAGGDAGRMGTRGVGIALPSSSAAFWGAAVLSLEARLFYDRVVSPVVGVSAGHPFFAPDVVIRGFGTVFEPPPLFARFHVGLRVHLF